MITALEEFDWRRGCLLLDFDGPVCSIFAGKPDFVAAERLRRVLQGRGVHLPPSVIEAHDPLVVLRYTGEQHMDLVPEVEQELQMAEVDAVVSAEPTPGALELIGLAPPSGVAIVSNNSAGAISRYLQLRQPPVSPVLHSITIIGRNPHDPALMKPSPHLVLSALQVTGRRAEECIMVGDSTTDVQAALGAGVRCIGFANQPSKASALAAAGADDVVFGIVELVECLRTK